MATKKKLSTQAVEWVRDYLNSFGGETVAVIGISGGKDSTIAAKICVEAVGANRVIGVKMPLGDQHDIVDARDVCKYLGIKSYEIDIKHIYETLTDTLIFTTALLADKQTSYVTNTPARIRMTLLYGIAAILGDARVVNTCNRSEDYVGYSTKFGDSAGDFSPLADLTVSEVKQIGRELKIPERFVEKIPEDGLSGKSDEDNFGFTYAELDDYLLYDKKPDAPTLELIESMHRANMHKTEPMPKFTK